MTRAYIGRFPKSCNWFLQVERITVVFMVLIHTTIQTDYNINILNKSPYINWKIKTDFIASEIIKLAFLFISVILSSVLNWFYLGLDLGVCGPRRLIIVRPKFQGGAFPKKRAFPLKVFVIWLKNEVLKYC